MSNQDRLQELEAEVNRLQKLAHFDPLTGALMRTAFEQTAEAFLHDIASLHNEKRSSFVVRSFSVLFIDADDFKSINDTYGHEAGDKALKRIVMLAKENIRHSDLVARWGGEEIVVGLLGAGEEDAYQVAEDIRKAVDDAVIEYNGESIDITVSIGVAEAKPKQTDLAKLIQRADKAMYEAKQNRGKNSVVRHTKISDNN